MAMLIDDLVLESRSIVDQPVIPLTGYSVGQVIG